jgi:hypothetical protein
MTIRRASIAIAAVGALAVCVAGCGSSSPSSGSTAQAQASTTPTGNYANQYMADVAPANTAFTKFGTAFKAWSNTSGTAAQTTAFVTPAVAAIQAFNQKVLAQSWPTSDRADVHALVAAAAAMSGDLSGLPSVNILDVSSWATQLTHDASIQSSAANTVRSDLGLPPKSN